MPYARRAGALRIPFALKVKDRGREIAIWQLVIHVLCCLRRLVKFKIAYWIVRCLLERWKILIWGTFQGYQIYIAKVIPWTEPGRHRSLPRYPSRRAHLSVQSKGYRQLPRFQPFHSRPPWLGHQSAQICRELGLQTSTISRELHRNSI